MKEITEKLLSLNKEQRNKVVNSAYKEAGIEIGEISDKEITDSKSKLRIGEFKTEARTKNWVEIKYGIKGNDYIYHITFKRPLNLSEQVIYYVFEQTVLPLVPDNIEVILSPPKEVFMGKEMYKIGCYTLIIRSIANRPTAKQRMENKLVSLLLNKLDMLYKLPFSEKEDLVNKVRSIVNSRRGK
jgi:hypothetical protein